MVDQIKEKRMRLQYIEAGEIVSTHGVRGEMKVLPWVDSPEILCEFDRVRINGREYKIELCRIQKSCNLLKLEGIDTMEAAQAMRGRVVELYREDIDDEVIFAAELIGMQVLCEGQEIGKIAEVLDYPGNSVYVVRGKHEYMIPAVNQFILSTDLESNVMQVKLIEGMRTDEN
jgi:16S rRNA processing protein RimM